MKRSEAASCDATSCLVPHASVGSKGACTGTIVLQRGIGENPQMWESQLVSLVCDQCGEIVGVVQVGIILALLKACTVK